MNAFIEEPPASSGKKIVSVSQFSQTLQKNLQDAIPFAWITGELSGVFHAQSGHVYATIKDASAQIKIVIYQFVRKNILFNITEGLHVNIGVQPAIYKPKGELQLIVKVMEPEGLGALQLAFEQLRDKLLAEGLFESSRKKNLPKYPKAIGVISSPDGAVWHDILRVIERRYPIIPVFLYPCSVQGPQSVKEILAQLALAATEKKADVYILARGGGSLSDLWSFNTEEVVRAVEQFPWPIVSAIGHETDVTLVDFVADKRAPTPSIAAELVTPELQQIYQIFDHHYTKIHHQIRNHLRSLDNRCDRLEQSWRSPIFWMAPLQHRMEKAAFLLKTCSARFLHEKKGAIATHTVMFQSHRKGLLQKIRFIRNQAQTIAHNQKYAIQNQIQTFTQKLLALEAKLLARDPNKGPAMLSFVSPEGKNILRAQDLAVNDIGILAFPDGKWRVQCLELMKHEA